MPWGNDRGIHGIVCFPCRGKGKMLGLHISGVQQIFTCRDCDGTGFVKHCVACQGTGTIKLADDGNLYDCPECSGKGYPLPKRLLIQMG